MYLSRVKINTTVRNTIKFLSSPQVIHASVEGCFNDDDTTRKLWRVDCFRGQPCLLVLSQEKPNFAQFIAQFGFEGDCGETRDYQCVLDCVENGKKYRFRLCANPVYSLKSENGKRGKVVPHVTVRQQEAWLEEKCVKIGFSLDESFIVQRELKRFTRQGKYVTLHTAVYEGILTVCHADIFRETLVRGIGRAKSYGCGMLTLARL